jgi:hypothetical protein
MAGESWYDTVQVCLNGHIANAWSIKAPQHNQKFCTKCGQRTVTACPGCEAPIRGHLHPSFSPDSSASSAYCHNCGKPYPWTERALKAARDLSDDLEELTADEREKLQATLDDLVKDSPQTTVAAGGFNRLLTKAGRPATEAFRQILVDAVSETAKKIIFPHG